MSSTRIPNEVYRAVKDGPVPGLVPAVEKDEQGYYVALRKPSKPTIGKVTPIPQHRIAQMQAGLPAEVRRTAREKFAELVKMLYADAERSFSRDGRIVWPKSITNELEVLGKAQGKQNILQQVETLARRYIEKGAREQQAIDRKRTTRDYHGHLSA